jgi:hypothetical protein
VNRRCENGPCGIVGEKVEKMAEVGASYSDWSYSHGNRGP